MITLVALMIDMVRSLDLDLTGKVVITEAASGAYAVTPVLAAVAGAEVHALGRDSTYGTFQEVGRQIGRLLDEVGTKRVTLIDEVTPDLLESADVITNTGHLRPLDRDLLRHVRAS